jgi:hypothetical protein
MAMETRVRVHPSRDNRLRWGIFKFPKIGKSSSRDFAAVGRDELVLVPSPLKPIFWLDTACSMLENTVDCHCFS